MKTQKIWALSLLASIVVALSSVAAPIAAAESKEAGEQEVKPAPLTDILNFHAISDELYTAGQVLPEHVAAVAAADIEMLINLAPANEERNLKEGFLISQQGIAYVHIPVDWDKPTDQDLSLFFAMMDARGQRKTMVHCFANYRGSAFTYLYRVLRQGVDEPLARKDLHKVWDKEAFEKYPQWRAFIDKHLATSV